MGEGATNWIIRETDVPGEYWLVVYIKLNFKWNLYSASPIVQPSLYVSMERHEEHVNGGANKYIVDADANVILGRVQAGRWETERPIFFPCWWVIILVSLGCAQGSSLLTSESIPMQIWARVTNSRI